MLSKSAINRVAKLFQIKNEPWFSAYSWENLVSLNVDPPFIPNLTSGRRNDLIPFVNHIKNIKEWIPTKSITIDSKIQTEFDLWYKNF